MKKLLLFFSLALFAMPPADAATSTPVSQHEFIVLGGGCFWCLDAAYKVVPGVVAITSGYAGGHLANPSYEDVCTGETGHAEVVKIEYDPQKTSLEKLLDFFWQIHDPTLLNQQGADRGTQYRSIILYANDAQREVAEKSKKAAQANFSDPIVTEIVPLNAFYRAEDYHQDYFAKNPYQGYCQAVVRPKVAKAKKLVGQH